MRFETEQGSPAWHSMRAGRITATRAASILGHGWGSPASALAEMTGRGADQTPSAAMLHGTRNEVVAAAEHQLNGGRPTGRAGFYVYDYKPFIAASPDREYADGIGLLEIKCPKSRGIPDKPDTGYIIQVYTQMLCAGRKYADLLYYVTPETSKVRDGSSHGKVFRIEWHQGVADEMVARLCAWYAHHVVGGAPAERGRKSPGIWDSVSAPVVMEW